MEKVLVIIPAYNEAENITQVINSIHSAYPEFDILVVNDGSTDETGTLAQKTGKASIINLPFNVGIGGCVQTGFKFFVQNDYSFVVNGNRANPTMIPWKLPQTQIYHLSIFPKEYLVKIIKSHNLTFIVNVIGYTIRATRRSQVDD